MVASAWSGPTSGFRVSVSANFPAEQKGKNFLFFLENLVDVRVLYLILHFQGEWRTIWRDIGHSRKLLIGLKFAFVCPGLSPLEPKLLAALAIKQRQKSDKYGFFPFWFVIHRLVLDKPCMPLSVEV